MVSRVIKAYVEKQRREPQSVAVGHPTTDNDKIEDGKVKNGKTDVGAVWTSPDEDGKPNLQSGHFYLDIDHKRAPLASAAPGLR